MNKEHSNWFSPRFNLDDPAQKKAAAILSKLLGYLLSASCPSTANEKPENQNDTLVLEGLDPFG